MASFDPISPSSSNPNIPLSTFHLSSEELEDGQGCFNRTDIVGAKWPAALSSTSLSSQSSAKGDTVKRVRKRKASGGARRPPHEGGRRMQPTIRRLSADKANFKDIVHQFTGIPSPPPSPQPFNQLAAASQHTALLAAALMQSLETLHIFSSCLLPSQDNNMMLNKVNKSKSLDLLKVLLHAMATHNSTLSSSMSSGSMSSGCDLGHNINPNHLSQGLPQYSSSIQHSLQSQGLPQHQHSHQSQQVTQLESFLLADND